MTAAFAAEFTAFAATTARRAPLYSRLSTALATSALPEQLFASAPAPARVPVNLFAAVHYLLLAEPDAPLARCYACLTPNPDAGDPVPAFFSFCAEHAAAISELVATRLPQTNEIGRSALLLAGFGQLGVPVASHLDIGASAGLNLMVDRLAYTDGHGHRLGSGGLELACEVRGSRPRARGRHGLADALPGIGFRLGLDSNPIDPGDPEATRWLRACVWPDQLDRLERLDAALALAASVPGEVVAGDAVAGLAGAVDRLPGLPAITTSWVLCYLEPAAQVDFVAELDRLGQERDLAWLWVEAPHRVPALPVRPGLAGRQDTLLGYSRWQDGRRTDRTLARCHPHGYWLEWF